MRISKSQITPDKITNYEGMVDGFADQLPYPIKSIPSCACAIRLFKKAAGIISCAIEIDAETMLRDSRDDVPFKKHITIEDEFLILDKEDGESEGIIIPEEDIDLASLVVSVIKSNLPMRVTRKGSKLPKAGEGYSVSEEDGSEQAPYNPAFDKLKDLDL